MRLVCPSCGAMHSAEAWRNDPIARDCLGHAAGLPGPVSDQILWYLALFRPSSKRGLQWGRTLRLLVDFEKQVGTGYIHQAHKVDRPACPEIWAQAMTRMIDFPPGNLPVKNHNYLRAIVYDLANEADRAMETARNAAERTGNAVYRPNNEGPVEVISKEELHQIRMSKQRR